MNNVKSLCIILLIPPVCTFFLHKLLLHCHYSLLDHKKEAEEEEEEEEAAAAAAEEEIIDRDDMYNVWQELGTNLLVEIVERLSLSDQARFRAVCKDWLAASKTRINTTTTSTTKSLPWYAEYDRQLAVVSNNLQFRLYDPLSTPNHLVSVQNISLTKLGIPSPLRCANSRVSYHQNWCFVCIAIPKLFSKTRRYFLLYSPLTKQLIQLPSFEYPSGTMFRRTFTTNPLSPSCVFYLLNSCTDHKFVVGTCRKSDSEWTIREFNSIHAFLPCDCRPVCIHGIMYIVSPYGQLASYNIDDGEFRFENLGRDETFTLNNNSSRTSRTFELNGELMMLYFHPCPREENSNTSPGKQCIKQFDWSNRVWIPVSTLGDKTLFVSSMIGSVGTVNREEMRYNGVLSNKIYHFFDGGCIIYSLEDGDLVEFNSINSNLLRDGDGDLPEYKYNCGITPHETFQRDYLEPPDFLC